MEIREFIPDKRVAFVEEKGAMSASSG